MRIYAHAAHHLRLTRSEFTRMGIAMIVPRDARLSASSYWSI